MFLKGVAARSGRADRDKVLAELELLAGLVYGQSTEWLVTNTTCYGVPGRGGVKQPWSTSCGPAIKLVAEAEIDPLLAMQVNLDPRGWQSSDNFAAKRQRNELEDQGGVAVKRGSFGWGRAKGVPDLFPLLSLSSLLEGVKTIKRPLPASTLDEIARVLLHGLDVPLRVAAADNQHGHIILAVDSRRSKGERQFKIHDPWTGKAEWYDDEVLTSGWLCPTKGIQRRVTHVYLQQAPERQPSKSPESPR